jgi:DNA-binding CsgD family transcriptional regulator
MEEADQLVSFLGDLLGLVGLDDFRVGLLLALNMMIPADRVTLENGSAAERSDARGHIGFVLDPRPGATRRVELEREERDFSAEERRLLDKARPYVIQCYRNALEHDRLAGALREATAPEERLHAALAQRGLTARESDVMREVALGRSAGDAARDLGISERTVRKHLERAYRKLGVKSRSQAARVAWDMI